jgi:hypothetical protein
MARQDAAFSTVSTEIIDTDEGHYASQAMLR